MAAYAGAYAAIARATKASGVIVQLEPDEFQQLVQRMQNPLIVVVQGRMFSPRYQYLTTYKGLAFYATSKQPLQLPGSAEIITSGKIWVP